MAVEKTEGTIDSSINPKRIIDWDSFNEVTADPHQVAGLYFYSMLDCLVDLAHKVSYDFFKTVRAKEEWEQPQPSAPRGKRGEPDACDGSESA